MKTIVVLSALAAIAYAAPTQLEEGLKPNQDILLPKSIKRERKSPTFGKKFGHEHGGHFISHEPIITHPVHHHHIIEDHHHVGYRPVYGHQGHYGGGLGHFRSQEDVSSENSKEKCAKEVEAKCGADVNESPNNEVNLENNIKMARTAVEKIQHNLEDMEKTSKTRSGWKNAETESDIVLHENIETARAALEHVQKSFDDLHLTNQHTATLKEADMSNLKKLPEEQRMAQWKEAIENIQKNVEIANNIKESFRNTNSDDDKAVASGTSSTIILKNADSTKPEKPHNLETKTKDNEMETSATQSKKVVLKFEIEDKNLQKQSQRDDSISKMKSSVNEAEENLKSVKEAEINDDNKKLLLEPGKNLDLNEMRASEINKDLHHEIDTIKTSNLDSELKNQHDLFGKAVEKSKTNDQEKEVQQERWHHDESHHLNKDHENINKESFVPDGKDAHIDASKSAIKSEKTSEKMKMHDESHHDFISQDVSQLQEENKEKSANIDSTKTEIKKPQENNNLNEKAMKTIEHQEQKAREHVVNGLELESNKKTDDMTPHESAPVASIISMKSATEEIHPNLDDQLTFNNEKKNQGQINTKKEKSADPTSLNSETHFLQVPENVQLQSKSSMKGVQPTTQPKFHEMNMEHAKDAELSQLRKSESETTSTKSTDDLINKESTASEQNLKSKDSLIKSGKSAEIGTTMEHSLLKDPVREAAIAKNNGWRKSHHLDFARSPYGVGVAGIPAGGYGGGAGGYGAEASVGSGQSSGSGGAVGVFPNANVGGCAVPLLLSCSPSVVSGSLAKAHHAPYSGALGYGTSGGASYGSVASSSHASSIGSGAYGSAATSSSHLASSTGSVGYGAPAYKSNEGFNLHKKRDTKKVILPSKSRRTPVNIGSSQKV